MRGYIELDENDRLRPGPLVRQLAALDATPQVLFTTCFTFHAPLTLQQSAGPEAPGQPSEGRR